MVAHDRTRLTADSFSYGADAPPINAVEATAASRALKKKKKQQQRRSRDAGIRKTI
jgi:7-keto-8-aminopelargonate synthetase-like enzyme